MRRTTASILLGVASLLLLSALPSCGDGSGAPSEPQEDAASILGQAHSAMSGLNSFRAVMTIESEEARFDYTIEWQRPDAFHLVIPWEEREDEAVGEKGVGEAIVVGDRIYGRQCKAENKDCSDWMEAERGDVYLPAPSPSFDPRWPIVALDLVLDGQIVGEDEIDHVSSTHIQGKVNGLRAIYQALEESLRQRGVATYGQECEAPVGEPEECRDVPIEEFMQDQADDIRRRDESPAPVDVWIGRDDKRVRRLTVGPAPDDPVETATTVTFTYSRFDQVQIGPPE